MSIKKNFIYNSILTTASYIFPLITFPYVSRVLGVTNIGICNFVDSIINYFVLFSMMGVQTMGIREIAKVKGNKAQMSSAFTNIVVLNLIFVFIFSIILFIAIQIVPQFSEHKTLMYVGFGKLLATFMLIEWLYKGVEDFKYITIRSIIIRFLFVISVFVFVRKQDDYPIYFALLIIAEGVNAVINCIHARKYVKIVLTQIRPFLYLSPFLVLGCYALLTQMYKSFNIVYLGFISNTTEVGYYTTATKLHTIFLALFSAFTGVMLPRMSSLIASQKTEEFKKKIEQSYSVLVYFSIPVMVFGICYASDIIALISGPGYEGAVFPLMIVFPLVFIIGFEQILVHQILLPLKKDREVFINSTLGAIVGISANLLFVRSLGCIGSALVWTVSEIAVMISAIYTVNKTISLSGYFRKLFNNFVYSIPAILICLIIKETKLSGIILMAISSTLVFIYYTFLHVFYIKDKFFLSLFKSIFKKGL